MREFTMGSLFAGIGGFDLGFERAGFTTKWQVEIDPFATKVLAKNFPHAKRFGDIRTVGAHNLAPVDVICGGFPCQDISNAGKRVGIEGERSGLWREHARVIRELRPRFVLVENVAALLGRGIGVVLGDLAVGADHIRERVWILSYPNSAGVEPIFEQWRKQCEKEMGEDAADDYSARSPRRVQAGADIEDERDLGAWSRFAVNTATPFPGLDGAGKAVLGRGEDGIPNRVDRMHCLGNSVVPQIPELFARRIRTMLEADHAR